MKARSEQVLSIQYLRGLAALMVVVNHALDQFPGFRQALPTDLGNAGVDIFFVISGFVMTYTSRTHDYDRRVFLSRRIVRIVPIYWIVTFATAAGLLFGSAETRHSAFSVQHLLASLFFIPMHNPGMRGSISPVLKLGWTLNYEMFFYLAFAAALPLRPALRMLVLAAVFLAMAVTAFVWPMAPTAVVFWGNSIIFEFLWGCIVAELCFSGALRALPRPLLAAIALAGIAGLVAAGFGSSFGLNPLAASRILVFGIPAALLVAAAMGLEKTAGTQRKHAFALFLGDASYSIYLVHLFAVVALRLLWARLGLPTTGLPTTLVFAAACVVAGGGFGCLVYAAVERPVTSRVKKLVFGSPRYRLSAKP